MNAPELNEDFLDMLTALEEAQVEFIVVGAHALAAHGHPRATGDIDIWVRPTKDNAGRVLRALRAFGAPIAQHGVSERDFEEQGTVYQIGLPPRRIDILTAISGVSFDEAWESRLPITVSGCAFSVLARETLIANKRASARAKDLVDVATLERDER